MLVSCASMAQAGSHFETEIKLRVDSAATVGQRLHEAGFKVSVERVHEQNTVYDTPDLSLRNRGCLLRLRTAGAVNTVTFKGPSADTHHKVRQETEFIASDAFAVATVFTELGYQPVFRYEKYRTEFNQTVNGGTAVVDETPIGIFLELEGEPEWIDKTAATLGFSKTDYITASYGRLYVEYCTTIGVTPTDMLFPAGSGVA